MEGRREDNGVAREDVVDKRGEDIVVILQETKCRTSDDMSRAGKQNNVDVQFV